MKKILCILTAFLILIFSFPASAAVLTCGYEYNATKNSFIISGTSNDTISGDEVTIEGYLDGTFLGVLTADTHFDNGEMRYVSEDFIIDSSAPSGKIYFRVTSAHSDSAVLTDEYNYVGVDFLHPVLKDIQKSIENNDYSAFLSLMLENKDSLAVEADVLSSLSESGSLASSGYFSKIKMNIPQNIISEEDYNKVFEELLNFRREAEKMIATGEFADISSHDEFDEWYEKYNKLINMKGKNEIYFSYFENAKKLTDFYSILSSESLIFENPDKISDRLFEVGALVTISNGNEPVTKQVFDDFKGEITKSYALDVSSEILVFSKIAGQSFSSFEKLSEKYNTEAYNILYPVTNPATPSRPGGSSATGGSGGRISLTPITSGSEDKSQTKKEIFTDMSNVSWAKEAVYSLYEKGIVSGRNENTFDPNANITRAEFVKMLVEVKGADIDNSDVIFSDVLSSEWFFGYVNTAYSLNITKGYLDGTFKPYDNITREDMAVMIYRFSGEEATESNLTMFSDSENISGYAKTAVSSLYSKNIINGMGDGTFLPKANATRAQAAQMIYNFIK